MIQFRMVPLRRSLGQAGEVSDRAQKAVDRYAELLAKAATLADEKVYQELLTWTGRDDMPGSPAERNLSVLRDIQESQTTGPAVFQTEQASIRVNQLEAIVTKLEGKVNFALQAYGSLPAPGERAGGKLEGVSMATWCAIGGIALLGLVIMPLLLD